MVETLAQPGAVPCHRILPKMGHFSLRMMLRTRSGGFNINFEIGRSRDLKSRNTKSHVGLLVRRAVLIDAALIVFTAALCSVLHPFSVAFSRRDTYGRLKYSGV